MAANVELAKPLLEVSAFLDNYWNRDQVFRTLQYASTLCSGLLEPRLSGAAVKFSTFSSSLSNMRTTLRLIDDIPNLAHLLSGSKRQKDSSRILQIADFLSSLSSLLYYPTEHIAWAADLKLLPIQSTQLWNFCVVLWITSLATSCVRSLATLWRTRREMRMLQNRSQSQPNSATMSPTSSRSGNGQKRVTFEDEATSSGRSRARSRVLRGMYYRAAINLVQSLSDLMNAVHYLPSGVLWGGKLPTVWVGIFGTLSSALGFYKMLPHSPRPS